MKKFTKALLTLLVLVSLLSTALAATVRTTGNVWLRKGPGLGYSKITSVSSGTKLEYAGKTSTDNRGVKWYYVKYHGTKCWVSSRYSKLSGSSSSSSSKSSSSSSSKKSSATATPKPDPTPAPEPEEEVLDGTVEVTEGETATDASGDQTLEIPTFGEPEPVELSPWYLKNLEETANALALGKYEHDVTALYVNAYSNEVLLIGGDTTVHHFRITGEGYAVYGVYVGMDMDKAAETLTAAGLARTDNILGASFQHYAEADAPVNVNGFDSFINIIADVDGKVAEISWSVYSVENSADSAN